MRIRTQARPNIQMALLTMAAMAVVAGCGESSETTGSAPQTSEIDRQAIKQAREDSIRARPYLMCGGDLKLGVVGIECSRALPFAKAIVATVPEDVLSTDGRLPPLRGYRCKYSNEAGLANVFCEKRGGGKISLTLDEGDL
jgi:hypothetical protein